MKKRKPRKTKSLFNIKKGTYDLWSKPQKPLTYKQLLINVKNWIKLGGS